MVYDVHLEMFEGPLDLLLYLIKKSDLEVSEIPIAQITREYLDYIDMMKELNLEVAGDFLVMAATLMQIKSQMLLPSQNPEEEEGPNPLEELKAKLMEYQKFKDVAKELGRREDYFSDIYYRPPPVFEKDDYVLEVSLFDLLSSFKNVLQELPDNVKEIIVEEIPIEQKIREILDLFEGKEFLSFDDILKRETNKRGLILCFLAMLELIRLKQIIAKQTDLFSEIRVYRVKEEAGQQVQVEQEAAEVMLESSPEDTENK
jgi:segregation and condensation protein A